jgi:AhpD family alkylhydroperoxidase
MRETFRCLRTIGMTIGVAGAMFAGAAVAQDAQTTYRDIEATLGSVPTFFKLFPEEGIGGAWSEFKTVQLNPKTALSGKEKELIGLAVAAQIPCTYCIYFHTEAAKLNGATDAEIREAVAMAAITRHWSTILNGMQADPAAFRQETDTVLHLAAERMKAASAK